MACGLFAQSNDEARLDAISSAANERRVVQHLLCKPEAKTLNRLTLYTDNAEAEKRVGRAGTSKKVQHDGVRSLEV